MTEIEELLKRDLAVGVPEPPDPAYTVARIRRRIGHGPAQPGRMDLTPILAGLGAGVGAVVAVLLLGLSPLWLLVWPLAVLPLCPILLRKGA